MLKKINQRNRSTSSASRRKKVRNTKRTKQIIYNKP